MPHHLTIPTIDIDDPAAPARAWEETVTLPTYVHGEALPHPMFLEKRVYQGSSGRVYPLPVVDKVGDTKVDRSYRAVFLENRWLKVMLLPELGGRVHMAYDKQHDYHFVYFNEVVKPALVGLAGPWISGGIEFNWPQHHRPSTYLPVGFHVEPDTDDGSAACIIAETDRMYGTRAAARFSLTPDHAALRIDVTLTNPTDQPQTFLWWANPAVAAHDDYQSVFPPDVHAVMDHGKRDVSAFPIARGTYYKVDYSRGPEPKDAQGRGGTDISRYKNIPVPTSYMAYHSVFDFLGGYDHGREMGLLHVADHHRVPGKKQWTWGHGDFGQAWDRELTDDDGPYVELMVGAFTDNQPDFSWLEPGEEKRFTQHFMPYQKVGMVKNANTDLQLGLEAAGEDQVRVAIGASRGLGPLSVELVVEASGEVLWQAGFDTIPGATLVKTVPTGGHALASLVLRVLDSAGQVVLSYQQDAWEPLPIPEPARAVIAPEHVASVEQCYLAGQHLEQYRHATREPSDWYREGLRRDAGDVRCNDALGLLLLRRGCFAEAKDYFRRAVARQLERNPNPYDGEPYYNLGQCLFHLGRDAESVAAFQKAAWNAGFQGRAYACAARGYARLGGLPRAVALAEEALRIEPRNALARRVHLALKLALASDDNTHESARQSAHAAAHDMLAGDPLDLTALYVLHRMGVADATERLRHTIAGEPGRLLELAMPLYQLNRHCDVLAALALDPAADADPLLLYLRAINEHALAQPDAARATLQRAATVDPGTCFPSRIETICVLERAIELAQALGLNDGQAPYLLGNLLYDKKQHRRAVALWEQAAAHRPDQPTCWRNLGLAYYNQLGDPAKARQAYDTACQHAPDDARLFYELDQLKKETSVQPAERLAELSRRDDLCRQRDDLMVERITLTNTLGRPAEALTLLMGRVFHPWEGGEGKVSGQYRVAHLLLAAQALHDELAPAKALALLDAALDYPPNLGEGKLAGQTDNDLHYWRGRCFDALGDTDRASAAYTLAMQGDLEVGEARFYNDMPPELAFWAAMAMRAAGRDDDAERVLNGLALYAEKRADQTPEIDYFAVSLPDFLVFEQDLAISHRLHCIRLTGLALLGEGKANPAGESFAQILDQRPDDQGAAVMIRLAEFLTRPAPSTP